jgi:DNA-binding NtrC family response regulator
MECLENYFWPGNVRELKNMVERIILISEGDHILESHIPHEIRYPDSILPEICVGNKPLDKIMADIETNVIRRALERTHGNQTRAAELLGLPSSTLRTKMNKYNLK